MLVVRLIFILILIPFFTHAAVVINEIMYDLEGNDTDREWVEIYNDSGSEINLSGWKFNDGSNHILNDPPKNGGQGSLAISAGGYAIFAADASVFLSEHLNYSGTVIDTVMSLNNTSDTLKLINPDGAEIDSVVYDNSLGAKGDGKSLQKINEQWAAADPTPGLVNSGSDSQQNSQSDSSESTPGESTPGVGSQGWPVEPQIYANAGSDKTAVAGADVVFTGEALGLNKEPLANARYVWSFGDGGRAEGKSVKHIYKYPSEYIAVLNISSGEYSTSDIVSVKVIPNQLIISEVNKDFIKLQNDSGITLDISGWFLRGNNSTFRFPETTLIKAKASLPISSDISGIQTGNSNQVVEILYPNGSVAYLYSNTSKSTTVVDSVDSKVVEPKESLIESKETVLKPISIKESKEISDQIASVVVAENQENSWDVGKWFLIVLGLGIFSGIGFAFLRRVYKYN